MFLLNYIGSLTADDVCMHVLHAALFYNWIIIFASCLQQFHIDLHVENLIRLNVLK